MSFKRSIRKGFTLIEILIVVVILGILAAIVIPQFTNASQEAAESSVKSQLQTVRSQVELFRVRNNGNLPADFNDLMTPPNGEDPYLQKTPTLPTGYEFVWGDNGDTTNIETIYVTFAGATLPEGLTLAEIESWEFETDPHRAARRNPCSPLREWRRSNNPAVVLAANCEKYACPSSPVADSHSSRF